MPELKGATMPYTSVNGNRSSYLSKAGYLSKDGYLSKESKLALRLPGAEREAFLRKYKTRLCEAYGIVQREYAEVPGDLLARTAELSRFFEISYDYVSSLKPKATTRKKKASS